MTRRHPPLPSLWLMTDERQGEALWDALERLPRGSGVVFRHYSLGKVARRDLLERVRLVAGRRRLVLIDSRHRERAPVRIVSVHSLPERISAERKRADLLLVSPVFTTRSHPGARPLGRVRFGLLIRGARAPVVALGGMTPDRARSLRAFGVHGWAAIDAWSGVRT